MADYISREAAVTIADYAADEYPYDKDPKKPETYSEYNQGWHDACDYIRGKLEEEKPADVESVQHWEWIEDHDYLECPKCGVMVMRDFTFFDIGDWNYCPNCGEKMDFKEDNHD